jgi:hypothetical protein
MEILLHLMFQEHHLICKKQQVFLLLHQGYVQEGGKVNLSLQQITKNNQVYHQEIQVSKEEECKKLKTVKTMVVFYKALVEMPQQLEAVQPLEVQL